MIGHFQHRKLGWSSKWLWSLKIAYRMIPSSIHGWSKIIEGSLQVKLRTVWTDEKQRWEESEKRREEKKKKEDQKRESLRRKNDPGLRKSRKVTKHCVFPMICGSGGSTSTKAAGAEPAGQMRDKKNCTAVVARSTFRSHNVQNTLCSDHFWKLRCRKIARRCGAKHISKSKCTKQWLDHFSKLRCRKSARPLWLEAHFEVTLCKTHYVQTTFGSCDVEKVHAVVARSTFRSQKCKKLFQKKLTGLDHFWKLRCRFAWQAEGIVHLVKVSKTWGFCSISKNDGRRGTFEEDLARCISRGSAVQETCSSEMLGGQGTDFLRRVAFWSIRSVGLLRWFGVTGAALRMTWHHFFVAGAVAWTDGVEKSQKRIGTRLSALHSTFHFWRKSRRIVSFLMLSTKKLAELFCFWCCQVQKLRRFRRIASFLMLSSSKIEEVSQLDRQTDRQTDKQTDRQTGRQIDR